MNWPLILANVWEIFSLQDPLPKMQLGIGWENVWKKVVGLQSMWLRSQLGMASCKHRDCHKWPSCYHMKLFSICWKGTLWRHSVKQKVPHSVKDHVDKACKCLKGSVIPLGLWSDATPMNWDRSESLELILINLPGIPHNSASRSWRFPIAAISHKHVAKGVTFNEIFEVLSWSFQQLFVGKMPCQRHDGKPFDATQCSILQKCFLFWSAIGVKMEVGVECKLGWW